MTMTLRTTLLLLGALALAGCSTYDNQFAKTRAAYIAGDYDEALKVTSKEVKSAGDGEGGIDALLWKLENAAILRTAGRFAESDKAFEKAREQYMAYLLDADKMRLSASVDILTTPANSRYWGTGYDGLMIDVYQTLNMFQLGDLDAARVSIVRSYLLQQEIVANNAARIEKEQEALAKDENSSKGLANADNQKLVADANSDAMADMADVNAELQAYADYVNPFAVYLDGLFHYARGDDTERARKSFERAAAFAPQNGTVRRDYEAASANQPIQPSVYIIFETGMAPRLEQKRIDIFLPSITVPGDVVLPSHVGIAYPRLVADNGNIPFLAVTAPFSGKVQTVKTARVMSMDAVVGREFKNHLPGIMAKAIASTITKAVASAIANTAAKKAGGAWGQLGAAVGTAALSAATNVADTRSWQTLPKEFQVLRCDMPEDRTLSLMTADQHWKQEVTVMAGDVIVVYVKAAGSSAQPISVNQFKLK